MTSAGLSLLTYKYEGWATPVTGVMKGNEPSEVVSVISELFSCHAMHRFLRFSFFADSEVKSQQTKELLRL